MNCEWVSEHKILFKICIIINSNFNYFFKGTKHSGVILISILNHI